MMYHMPGKSKEIIMLNISIYLVVYQADLGKLFKFINPWKRKMSALVQRP